MPSIPYLLNSQKLVCGFSAAYGRCKCALSLFNVTIQRKNQWWISANYKETDLNRIRKGQLATIKVDMYPQHVFHGRVESISAGSGASFSLLPPESASGNWVKVTRRFPVRIKLIKLDPKFPLRLGASCTVTINTLTR